jgi:hypothetical protein
LSGSVVGLEAAMATVGHHLSPDGTFLFDLPHPRASELAMRVPPAQDTGPVTAVEPRRPLFAAHLRERKRASGTPAREGIHRLRLRHHGLEEVDAALRHEGLVPLERFGSFDGKPFQEDDDRQVVVASRSP